MWAIHWRNRDQYYRLQGVKCKNCEHEYFPPIYRCRSCGSRELEPYEMPKEGTVESYTAMRQPMLGFEKQEPMVFAIIRLDNGVRILGQVVDVELDEVRAGDRVRMVIRIVRSENSSVPILYGYKFVKA